MKLCIPTRTNEGLEALSSGHFGRSPYFTLVDTETDELTTLANPESGRRHGTCHPLHRLRDEGLDAIVCRNIGRGAYGQLRSQGIAVFATEQATVSEILSAARAGTLHGIELEGACRGGAQHGHRHRHGPGGCSTTLE